jgi:hypothetical protein
MGDLIRKVSDLNVPICNAGDIFSDSLFKSYYFLLLIRYGTADVYFLALGGLNGGIVLIIFVD